MCSGCFVHAEEEYIEPCGYEYMPYYSEPDDYIMEMDCGTWYTLGYYSECAEIWCYEPHYCGWELHDVVCYPI